MEYCPTKVGHFGSGVLICENEIFIVTYSTFLLTFFGQTKLLLQVSCGSTQEPKIGIIANTYFSKLVRVVYWCSSQSEYVYLQAYIRSLHTYISSFLTYQTLI